MFTLSRRVLRSLALALGTGLASFGGLAADTVKVFNKAKMGSVDYGQMGYVDATGAFVSLAGQQILGAWVDVRFEPGRRKDLQHFTAQMLVPVEGAQDIMFRVEASDLIPVAAGKYRAILTSRLFNGTVRPGRYSIETYGTNSKGERVPLSGQLSNDSGFHFVVTRPE